MGHGALMLMFALWMVLNERTLGRKDLGDILGMMFGGGYRMDGALVLHGYFMGTVLTLPPFMGTPHAPMKLISLAPHELAS